MNVIELASELVRIPSVNPDSLPEGQTSEGEGAMARRVEEILRGLGARTEMWEVYGGRPNVTGFFDFGAEETLIFDAHTDTVPTEGMVVEPFGGEVRDGRVYGRGACDVKGPAAAVLCALERAATRVKAGEKARFNVLYAGVCDEESGFGGVRSFVERLDGAKVGKVAGAIVVEPTLLEPIIAHKGVIRWVLSTGGVAAHSSAPELGVNAIYKMARVVGALEAYGEELGRRERHEHLGGPTLSVGVIQGGSAVNVVPDGCVIQVDRRLVPGETPAGARANLEEALGRLARGVDVVISDSIVEAPPMATGADANVVGVALEAVRRGRAGVEGDGAGDVAVRYASYCTDGSFYGGVPVVVIGPGSIAQAHTKDEWIGVEELEAGVEVFLGMVMG